MKKKPHILARKWFQSGKKAKPAKSGHKSKLRALRAQSEKRDLDTSPKGLSQRIKSLLFRLKEKIANTSFLWLNLKIFGLMILSFSFLLLTIYLIAFIFIDAEFIEEQLVNQAAHHTGGKLTVSKVDFNLNHGLTIHDLNFVPPSSDAQPPKENDPALMRIDEIRLHYDLPAIFLGRLELNALELVKPQFEVIQTDDTFNFAGIIEYRKKNFPQVSEPVKKEEKQVASKEGGIFLPLHPKLLYLPFHLKIERIGITDASVRFVQIKDDKTLLDLRNQGLNFITSLFFKGNTSELNISVASPENGTIDLAVYKSIGGADIEYSKPFVKLKSSLATQLRIENLMQVHVSLDQKIQELEGAFSHLQGLGSQVLLNTRLTDDLKGLLLEEFRVDLGEVLHYQLQGAVHLLGTDFKRFHLDIASSFLFSLSHAMQLAKPFVPQVDAYGYIEMASLKSKGELNLEKLSQLEQAELPITSLKLNLQRVSLTEKTKGLIVKPIDGSLSLSVAPSLAGVGHQLDTYSNFQFEGFGASAPSKMGQIDLNIEQLHLRSLARAVYPSMHIPILKFNLDSPHIRALTNGKKTIDVPFSVDGNGSFAKDLSDASLGLVAEVGELFTLTNVADCQQKCTKVRLNSNLSMNPLSKLHQMLIPVGRVVGKSDLLPQSLSGRIAAHVDVGANLPPLDQLNASSLQQEGKIRFFNQLVVERLGLQHPMFGSHLKGYDARGVLSGSLQEQKLEIDQSIGGFEASLPQGKDPLKINVQRLQLNTQVNNEISEAIQLPVDPNKLLPKLKTRMQTAVHLGKFDAGKVLPVPVADLSLDLDVALLNGRRLELNEAGFELASLGLRAQSDADVRFKGLILDKQLPASFVTNLKLGMDHTAIEHEGLKVDSSGQFLFATALSSQDMTHFKVSGRTTFKHFNLAVETQKEDKPIKLLQVASIVGDFPFKQDIDLNEYKALAEKKKAGLSTPITENQGAFELVDRYLNKSKNKLADTNMAMSIADYGSVRPFYPEKKPIHIKRIEAANLAMDNIEFDLELRQNWFSLNQFMMQFLGGKVHGSLQLSFDPLPHTFKTSLHLTRLNTHKLLDRFPKLQEKAKTSIGDSNPYIDGTVHLNYNLRDQDMSGGVDITSIGKEQVKMILFYVDPEEKDPNITQLKSLLNLGEVGGVTIPTKNGEIDIDVDVKAIGVLPLPVPRITRIPVASIIQNVIDSLGRGKKDILDLHPSEEEDEDLVTTSSL